MVPGTVDVACSPLQGAVTWWI